ncbi:MAG: transglycosylase domain-containing protein, partial [Gemmatimonadales bacterium]|nr:transglycosylase domain-containing protein [Gemmatimonadales bacterium]
MTWEMVSTRVRAAILALRARFDPRLAGRVVVGLGAFGMLGVGAEAAFRAELGPAEARLPTAFYSRPEPWGGDGEGEPMPIGSIASPILERRAPVRRSEVPDHLVAAILAVEDQRFFRHDGLDVKRIGGALVANLRAGAIVQGGSTITQQLAKNLYLSAERSPLRKVREAAIASVLEARYDKATILDAYLNEIYLG